MRGRVIAPLLYTGTMNSELFNHYLEHCLLPELEQGTVVIMDNASFHKSELTEQLIKDKGCRLLFLPPYSPELNPIEKIWAVLKSQIRRFRSQFDSLEETRHVTV